MSVKHLVLCVVAAIAVTAFGKPTKGDLGAEKSGKGGNTLPCQRPNPEGLGL